MEWRRSVNRVLNFEQKNGPLFGQNSACFAKQKRFWIPFRVIPQNSKDSRMFATNHFEAELYALF